MKILKSGTLCVLLIACALGSMAQKTLPVSEPDYNKPRLFADLPQKFALNIKAFELLLDLPEGKTINVPLTDRLRYQGAIVSKSDPADTQVQSVVIKSTNRLGSTFTFTRIRKEDGSYVYKGRLLSYKHSDAYEIQQENGQYILNKHHLYDLYSE
jgi:hypothetical protein